MTSSHHPAFQSSAFPALCIQPCGSMVFDRQAQASCGHALRGAEAKLSRVLILSSELTKGEDSLHLCPANVAIQLHLAQRQGLFPSVFKRQHRHIVIYSHRHIVIYCALPFPVSSSFSSSYLQLVWLVTVQQALRVALWKA